MNDEIKRGEAAENTEQQAEVNEETQQEENVEVQEPTAEQWREALELAVRQRDEYLAQAQRAQADYQNFKRRNQQTRTEAYDEGEREAIAAMLPVLDRGEAVLEVKYDDHFPRFVGGLLEGVARDRMAISKYCRCLAVLE